MSFSTKKVTNPAEMFFEFQSAKQRFRAYDKENQKDIELSLPAHFVVLDELSCVSGYSDKYNSSGYSNEVHYLDKEPLITRTFKGGYVKEGFYKDVKDELANIGLKYTKSIYALYVSQQTHHLVNIKLTGAAMGEWIDANIDTRKNIVVIEDKFIEKKKGATTYWVPVFNTVDLNEAITEEAVAKDKELQQYFKDKKELSESEE